jgi:hypothetical protein
MKLIDLRPRWVGAGGAGISNADGSPVPARMGVGISFDCPCGMCNTRTYLDFENPMDGGPPHADRPLWRREGIGFLTLSVTPSILRSRDKGGCGWHGYITNGEVTGRVE